MQKGGKGKKICALRLLAIAGTAEQSFTFSAHDANNSPGSKQASQMHIWDGQTSSHQPSRGHLGEEHPGANTQSQTKERWSRPRPFSLCFPLAQSFWQPQHTPQHWHPGPPDPSLQEKAPQHPRVDSYGMGEAGSTAVQSRLLRSYIWGVSLSPQKKKKVPEKSSLLLSVNGSLWRGGKTQDRQ